MSDASSSQAPVALSICIPTYNRSATLADQVRNVLSCPAPDLEVVVLDNGSTDDTLALLAEIQDARLSVHTNGHNRGVLFNVLQVLLKSRGTYSALLLDKDSLDPTRIEAFKEFLMQARPACGYSRYHGPSDAQPQTAPAGVPALELVGYAGHHPTGYFFRTDLLHLLDVGQRFSDYEYVGHFPFDFILSECCLHGPAALYLPPAFAPEGLDAAAKTKSFGTNAAKEDAFFSPKGRLKMTVNFSHHIQTLPVPASVKRQLVLDRLAQGMFAATLGYSRLMSNESICAHYHIGTRRIGVAEQLRTGWTFYQDFFRAYPGGRIGPDLRLSHTAVLSDWAARVVRGFKRRLARRSATRPIVATSTTDARPADASGTDASGRVTR